MDKKSKFILGLKRGRDFSEEERHKIVRDYLTSGKKKNEIWYQYTGQQEEHGQLLKWLRQLGYKDIKPLKSNFVSNKFDMKSQKTKPCQSEDVFENLQLKKRVLDLERQLKEAELKAIAFSTMVDMAEKEFNLSIRKKFNTKPLKK